MLFLLPIGRRPEEGSAPAPADGASGGPTTVKEIGDAGWRILIPGRHAIAAPLLLDVNVLVYLVMVICGVDFLSPRTIDLLGWGAVQRDALMAGGWWRLLTYPFLHAGLVHLVMNGVLLLMAGLLLEATAGWRWTLATYLLGGVAGGLASAAWGLAPSVGASGAVLALVGTLLVISYTRFGHGRSIGGWAIGLGLVNVIAGLKARVDGAAHVGGLAAGMIGGGLLYLRCSRLGPRTSPPHPSPANDQEG